MHHQHFNFITEVLRGLDFVFPYLDDVLIASSSEEEHEKHVKLVFDRFQQYGLRINLAKSVMGADQVEYLGYLITVTSRKSRTLDNQNEQNNVGQENDTSNSKEPHSLPDEEPTTSCGRKIKKPVRFRE
ncbi:retrovirus-related Pol polyprotein from transposon opus [Trichonephila clavata]|uniref:Retrovirus-related Pol polyprotein from transposon opus n=1 Tax=Trichonephila clavata TaxID=2740835 RepID=A0A8X6FAR8_TRICU|nr:retrovirus-related Pol polyprotein from transposon opus [Trichonephila clavata]